MRTRPVLMAFALAACGNKTSPPSDCSIVRDDPAHAMAKLSAKYAEQPVKVATIIEDCVAPTGPLCERVAKIVAAIPSMMPNGGPTPADPVTTCAQMPPELQNCMLPSYVLAHVDDCKRLLHEQDQALAEAKARSQVKIALPGGDASPDCPATHIYVDADALAYGRDRRIPLPARKDDIMNFSGLESGLKRLATECIGPVTVHVAPKPLYEDVVHVMDLAVQAGFTDIALSDNSSSAPSPSTSAPDLTPEQRRATPIVVITRTELQLDGTTLAHPQDADVTDAVKAALAALPADRHTGTVVLQADAKTESRTILQTITGARSAGFDNVLFAVKAK